MKVNETRIREIANEHAARSIELKKSAQSEVNRIAAEFHRGYALAMQDIANGVYEE